MITDFSLIDAHRRQVLAIFPNQPRQFKSAHKPWNENARLRNQSPQPAEIKPVHPIGYCPLIAGDESERSAYAMDRRPIRQIFTQIKAKLFLRAAAYRDDYIPGAMLFNQRKEISIFDIQTELRRDITILVVD